MRADIILVMRNGVVENQYLVKHSVTAEATFDSIIENLFEEEDIEEINRYFDYGRRLEEVNYFLKDQNREIIWLEQVKVNKFKN